MIPQFYVPIIHISYLQYWCLMLAFIVAKTCSTIDDKILSQPVAVIVLSTFHTSHNRMSSPTVNHKRNSMQPSPS